MSKLTLNIVLYQPEIPQNTGNIARTCAATGAHLHLIKPLGFSTRDKYLKRAGLDYWPLVSVTYHDDLSGFLDRHARERTYFLTKKANRIYDQIDFNGKVFLVFGKETAGIPGTILHDHRESCFRIPMISEARSLNVSNAAAIVVYEALRQTGFAGLNTDGKYPEQSK